MERKYYFKNGAKYGLKIEKGQNWTEMKQMGQKWTKFEEIGQN